MIEKFANYLPKVNKDPTLLPVKVRVYIAITIVALAVIAFAFKCDAWHKLAAWGLVLGIFGSGALYWETIADDVALQSVSNEISRLSSRKLSFSETVNIIEFSHYGGLVFFMLLAVVLLSLKSGQIDGFRAARGTGIVFIFCMSFSFLPYSLIKIVRLGCSTWFQKFHEITQSARTAEIKHLLRKTGFASLLLSGVMQLPATLL